MLLAMLLSAEKRDNILLPVFIAAFSLKFGMTLLD